jgi:hypothetical protein
MDLTSLALMPCTDSSLIARVSLTLLPRMVLLRVERGMIPHSM